MQWQLVLLEVVLVLMTELVDHLKAQAYIIPFNKKTIL